jgi:S-DNA-T family DNA segregation ATPase FtsK/SpoIIIE
VREKRLNEIKGVILIAVGLMVLASLVRFERLDLPFYTSYPNVPPKNLLGIFGAYLGEVIVFLFGRPTSFVMPALIILLGAKFFRQEKPYLSIPRISGMLVLLISISSLIGMFNLGSESARFYYAGLFGALLTKFITTYFSRLGGFIVFITLALLSLALVTETLLSSLFANSAEKFKGLLGNIFKPRKASEIKLKINEKKNNVSLFPKPSVINKEEPLVSRPKIQINPAPLKGNDNNIKKGVVRARPQELKIGNYNLPSLDLLDAPPPPEARQIKENLEDNARILEDTLGDFGIVAKVTDIERGPIITRYELEPAPGIKLSRIITLSDDIALSMKAQSVRILAPIPGKDRVGIEVPNTQGSFVYLKEVFASNEFQNSDAALTWH